MYKELEIVEHTDHMKDITLHGNFILDEEHKRTDFHASFLYSIITGENYEQIA